MSMTRNDDSVNLPSPPYHPHHHLLFWTVGLLRHEIWISRDLEVSKTCVYSLDLPFWGSSWIGAVSLGARTGSEGQPVFE
jgi:hypothetical protein